MNTWAEPLLRRARAIFLAVQRDTCHVHLHRDAVNTKTIYQPAIGLRRWRRHLRPWQTAEETDMATVGDDTLRVPPPRQWAAKDATPLEQFVAGAVMEMILTLKVRQ